MDKFTHINIGAGDISNDQWLVVVDKTIDFVREIVSLEVESGLFEFVPFEIYDDLRFCFDTDQ